MCTCSASPCDRSEAGEAQVIGAVRCLKETGCAPDSLGRLHGAGSQIVDVCQSMQTETRRGGHAASCVSQE
jgi:hypothetical protein